LAIIFLRHIIMTTEYQVIPADAKSVDSEAAALTLRRISAMPRDVGWLLVTAGVVGEVAPGVFGTPFWIMGTLILWPSMGRRMESVLERRAPQFFAASMKQVGRFLDDLERRYPPRCKPDA
jgi:hypothetical protein